METSPSGGSGLLVDNFRGLCLFAEGIGQKPSLSSIKLVALVGTIPCFQLTSSVFESPHFGRFSCSPFFREPFTLPCSMMSIKLNLDNRHTALYRIQFIFN